MPNNPILTSPKCRANAQIIGYAKVTTKCQNCAAALKIKNHRVFYSSNMLEKPISARTQLQAQMHAQSVEFGNVPGMEFVDDRPSITKPQKNAQKIILKLLRSADGALEIEILKTRAMDNDVDAERFAQGLDGLLRGGEVQSTAVGFGGCGLVFCFCGCLGSLLLIGLLKGVSL